MLSNTCVREVQQLILAKRAAGTGILLISENVDELMTLSDRIAVLVAGIRDARTPTGANSAI